MDVWPDEVAGLWLEAMKARQVCLGVGILFVARPWQEVRQKEEQQTKAVGTSPVETKRGMLDPPDRFVRSFEIADEAALERPRV